MSKRSTFSSVGRFFSVIGSAVAVSSAIENHRAPSARDLKVLGIDPVAFKKIQL